MAKKTHNSDVALKVEHVSKSFHLPSEKANGIKQAFINYMRGVKGYTKQDVLKDVSFEVKKGDFFGIVGRNGSGKSTLLKLISQIYTPDSGKIAVNGSLVPFIELGVGFNPELTGRENVYLNGAMLGFSRDEIDDMYEEIVEFAELHDFMDQKLKNYSSGMQVRLAFSVAIKAQGDILILDEVLAVGDEAFQRKCNNFFNEIKKDKNKTVVLVTHSMDSVRKYCDRAIMISEGAIVREGSPTDVSNEYSLENVAQVDKDPGDNTLQSNELVKRFNVEMKSKQILSPGDMFECDLTYAVSSDVPVRFGISIMDTKANYPIMNDWVKDDDGSRAVLSTTSGEYSYSYRWKIGGINNKELTFIATLYRVEDHGQVPIAYIPVEKGATFIVKNDGRNNALLDQEGVWNRIR